MPINNNMAHQHSGCPTLHQQFLGLELESGGFDGIFANASLFHIPGTELTGVLKLLYRALRPGGILFSSNPRGRSEGWNGPRYAHYMELESSEIFLQRHRGDSGKAYGRPVAGRGAKAVTAGKRYGLPSKPEDMIDSWQQDIQKLK